MTTKCELSVVPDVDPELSAAFERAAAMGDIWRDVRGRTYTWAEGPGLWRRAWPKPLRVVGADPDIEGES